MLGRSCRFGRLFWDLGVCIYGSFIETCQFADRIGLELSLHDGIRNLFF